VITANVIHRVFRIRIDQTEGTAFTIEKDGREYLVTAKHVADTVLARREIELFENAGWAPLQIELVGHASGDSDISVLAANRALTPAGLPMPATSNGLVYGQDVYFLGFPYGFLGRIVLGPNGYPLPFVKRATVSLFDGTMYLLDGHNNPGFSGGPVVWKPAGSSEFRVGAVISAYRYIEEPIYAGGGATPLTYRYNTGIIVSHGVEPALDLIAANAIGCAASAP
jgi:S1-C subfamily serine protease